MKVRTVTRLSDRLSQTDKNKKKRGTTGKRAARKPKKHQVYTVKR